MSRKTSAATAPAMPIEDIPLPPEGVADEMAAPGDAPEGASGNAPAAAGGAAVSTLDFADASDRTRGFDLAAPFHLNGELVKRIEGRRITIGEAGAVVDANPRFDRYDFYAVMTGQPADVLRGLDLEDGERLVEAFNDFLPRLYRRAGARASTSGTGESSPSD